MPFVRGRYHINPTMGEALEAAREAEAALLALEQQARAQRANGGAPDPEGDEEPDDGSAPTAPAGPGAGPVHRVEIEAAAVVPSHSGRGTRGFVARVHRSEAPANGTANATRGASLSPETHVFSDHRDLVSFLGDALAKE
jgi:hypothetical protein